MEEMITKGFS
jgi:hypothetical protein